MIYKYKPSYCKKLTFITHGKFIKKEILMFGTFSLEFHLIFYIAVMSLLSVSDFFGFLLREILLFMFPKNNYFVKKIYNMP